MKIPILAVWLLCCLSAFAGGKKDKGLVVSFHLQGAETDGPKMSVPQEVAGSKVFFRLSPEFSHKDIQSFRPFPADDGTTYGILFRLNPVSAKRLQSITNANRGSLLMARLNGRPIDVVTIDKTINDGLMVIWQGVTTREISAADKMMPRIGQTVKEWKKQK